MKRHPFRNAILPLFLAAFVPVAAQATTITVTGSTDGTLAKLAFNKTCDLREAIVAANTDTQVDQCPAGSASDTIVFDIPGGFLHVIEIENSIAGPLPKVTSTVSIDGYTQEGASVNTSPQAFNGQLRIALISKGLAGEVANGLEYAQGSSGNVRGLIIGGFGSGVYVGGNKRFFGLYGNIIGSDGVGNAYLNRYGVLLRSARNVVIGSAALADRNLIAGSHSDKSGNGGQEIFVYDTWPSGPPSPTVPPNVQITNNLIGTLADGDTWFAESSGDNPTIVIGSSRSIAVTGNVIGGRIGGIHIAGTSEVAVLGNRIGVGVSGGNIAKDTDGGASYFGQGISVRNSSADTSKAISIGGTEAGQGNIIANWKTAGVIASHEFPSSAAPSGVRMLANSIYGNGGLGIDLIDFVNDEGIGVNPNDDLDMDTGTNAFQNYPVATAASTNGLWATVAFDLNSAPDAKYRIDFYANKACDVSGHGEGESWLGQAVVATDGLGLASGNVSPLKAPPPGQAVLTMTATAVSSGDTSEFSACFQIKFKPIIKLPKLSFDGSGGNDTE